MCPVLQQCFLPSRCPLSSIQAQCEFKEPGLFGSRASCFLEVSMWPGSALSFSPVSVLLFTQLWPRWPPGESWPFLASQGLWYFWCFLKASFPHIQGLLSFPDLWLNNLDVTFLCHLYFQRIKNPLSFIKVKLTNKTIYLQCVVSYFDTYMHCKIVKSSWWVHHYYWIRALVRENETLYAKNGSYRPRISLPMIPLTQTSEFVLDGSKRFTVFSDASWEKDTNVHFM